MSKYTEITPELLELADLCKKNTIIDPELYTKYDVKRGLRDISGKGVLTGLTEICEILSYMIVLVSQQMQMLNHAQKSLKKYFRVTSSY